MRTQLLRLHWSQILTKTSYLSFVLFAAAPSILFVLEVKTLNSALSSTVPARRALSVRDNLIRHYNALHKTRPARSCVKQISITDCLYKIFISIELLSNYVRPTVPT